MSNQYFRSRKAPLLNYKTAARWKGCLRGQTKYHCIHQSS